MYAHYKAVHRRGILVVSGILSLVPIIFVFFISTYPNEWLGAKARQFAGVSLLHDFLFEGEPDVAGRTSSWFSNRIVLPDQTFVDPDKIDKIEVSHSFEGRDLRRAILNRSDLRKANFTGALLSGASFLGADLRNAFLGCPRAEKEPKLDSCAQLQEAQFELGNLKGAILVGAQLQGANFVTAQLASADLSNAKLQAADFSQAKLQGAYFLGAKLQAAKLVNADLEATYFFLADAQGADFTAAKLQGASFSHAKLQGAIFDGAEVDGSTFVSARMSHVSPNLKNSLVYFGDCDTDTMPWTGSPDANFTAWVDKALAGVPEHLLREAKDRLSSRINVPENRFEQICRDARYNLPNEEEVANFLGNLTCSRISAPDVARGLIRNARVAEAPKIADRIRKGLFRLERLPRCSWFFGLRLGKT